MRKANEKNLYSGIYARIREMQMSQPERESAIHALESAERIAGLIDWVKARFASVGGAFLRPSLKH